MVDLDPQALAGARPDRRPTSATALQQQNVILPSGDVKIGTKDYALAMNNSPDVDRRPSTHFPIKQVDGRTIFMRDVAHVHDGFQVQTNSVAVDGTARRADDDAQDRRRLDARGDRRRPRRAAGHQASCCRAGVTIKPIFDQSIFVKAALNSVLMGGLMAAGLTALMILLFLGNWRLTLIILASIPLSIITAMLVMYRRRPDAQHDDARRLCAGRRHPRRQRHGRDREHRAPRRHGRTAAAGHRRRRRRGRRFRPSLSTLCICIVFVPVFLLQGTAKYLFSPLSLSVIVSLLASLALSFTLVPVLFTYLMRSSLERHAAHRRTSRGAHARGSICSCAIHHGFEARLQPLPRRLSQRRRAWRSARRG